MKRLLCTILFFLSSVVIPGVAQTVAAPNPEGGIDALRAGLIESFKKSDIETLLTYLAPDVIVTWQNGEVCHGRDEVRAYYHRMMSGEKRIVKELTANPEISGRSVFGDWAISWGTLNDHFILSDGRDLALNSVFTITTAKRGDRWLVTSYHASINAFDNAVLTVAARQVAIWSASAGAAAGCLLTLAVVWVTRRRKIA